MHILYVLPRAFERACYECFIKIILQNHKIWRNKRKEYTNKLNATTVSPVFWELFSIQSQLVYQFTIICLLEYGMTDDIFGIFYFVYKTMLMIIVGNGKFILLLLLLFATSNIHTHAHQTITTAKTWNTKLNKRIFFQIKLRDGFECSTAIAGRTSHRL